VPKQTSLLRVIKKRKTNNGGIDLFGDAVDRLSLPEPQSPITARTPAIAAYPESNLTPQSNKKNTTNCEIDMFGVHPWIRHLRTDICKNVSQDSIQRECRSAFNKITYETKSDSGRNPKRGTVETPASVASSTNNSMEEVAFKTIPSTGTVESCTNHRRYLLEDFLSTKIGD